MRKNILPRALWALLVLMTCMACAVALETDYELEKSFTKRSSSVNTCIISASVEEPAVETKTELSGAQVVWKTGDQIKIFNASNTEGVLYTLSTGNGSTSGTFSGEALSGTGPYYAVYPASVAGTLSDSKVTINIQNTQVLASGSFGDGANIAFAKVDNLSDAFAFKNVLGAVKIRLSSSTAVTGVRIETKGTESLWGTATVKMNDGGLPEITPSITNTAYDNQIVTASGSASGTEFYVMVPPGSLAAGFVVSVMDNVSKAMVKSAGAVTVNRSAITPMAAFDYAPQFKSAFLTLEKVPFGYYWGIKPAETLSYVKVDKATTQFANKKVSSTRTFRLQNFSSGWMYQFAVAGSATLALGATYSASMESVVGSGHTVTDPADYKLIQKTTNAGWFLSSDNSKGFIILLED